jgi:type 1 glutamine amidotransferase
MFLIGEAEYASQESMPPLVREFQERYRWRTTTCISDPLVDGHDRYEFVGIESLADVDVLVVYTRFRRLAEHQMEMILDYVGQGRPVVALRTSTHSFAFPEGSRYRRYNDEFGTMLFGTPWRYHHGHSSSTDVSVIAGKAGHPILENVESRFHMRSWLYHVLPLPETCEYLLEGVAVDTELADPQKICPNPVAWTNVHRGGRVFYTSLGHPEDFRNDSFRHLVMNGILWAGGAR